MTNAPPAHLKKIEDRWIEDAIITKPSDVPDVVYHYTTAAGLFGMLHSKQLWLTDYRFLNDKTEFTHIYSILRDMREKLLNRGNLKGTAQKLLSQIEYDKMDSSDSFVFSLTSENDDLSQWRGYANDGMGFTVGLSGAAIYEESISDLAEFAFAEVDYNGEDQASYLERIFHDVVSAADRSIKDISIDSDQAISDAARSFDRICLNRGALIKHDSFRSEKEWRVVSYGENDDDMRVRLSGDKLVPYMPINLGGEGTPLPIKRIGIGPGFSDANIIDAVKALLRQTGHSAEIYFANTPYRRP